MEEGSVAVKLERLKDAMGVYGQDLTQGMLILVLGLLALHWFMRRFRTFLEQRGSRKIPVATVAGIVYILLLFFLVTIFLVYVGFDSRTVLRLLVILGLSAIALMILLRPYFPTLPFRAGQTIKMLDMFGKVERIDMFHTRIKTFDGKTVFVPNSKILSTSVINYHFTPSRRIKINLAIPSEEDLIRAKQLLEAEMIADPRVHKTPRPAVWVLGLDGGRVELGARCWAGNSKYWMTRVELIEKFKLTFDRNGIRLALPRQAVRLESDEVEEPAEETPPPEGENR